MVGPDRYKTITAYSGVIVADVQSSKLLTVGDTVPHSGGPGVAGALRDQVTSWLTAEADALAAAPLPATDTFAVVAGPNTVSLDKTGVAGATLTFTGIVSGDSITFAALKLNAPSSMGIHVVHPIFSILPGGSGAPANDVSDSFSNTDQTVDPGEGAALGDGLLILDVTATIHRPFQAGDLLRVFFSKIEAVAGNPVPDAGAGEGGATGGCNSVAAFTQNAVPAIKQNSCLGCHQGQNPTATNALDLTQLGTNDTAACAQALTRVNLADKPNSDILLAPTGGVAAHPFKNASANYKTMMLGWIQSE